MSAHYYNEIAPYAARWLRNLQGADCLPQGTVDERSIADVQAKDLEGIQQAHFFAGIGGWPIALRLAGWPEDWPVWTGSCPCQPFSVAGKAGGMGDERHLWPAFHRLIAECRPPVIFGEQVASADGRQWLSGVRVDLEGMGYAVGAADLCAAGVGAPHVRQRLYWVADATGSGGRRRFSMEERGREKSGGSGADFRPEPWPDHAGSSSALSVADILSPSHGVPDRVVQLRAYGNAIVPQVAGEFVKAYIEAVS